MLAFFILTKIRMRTSDSFLEKKVFKADEASDQPKNLNTFFL